jgi:hypothetical protein
LSLKAALSWSKKERKNLGLGVLPLKNRKSQLA